jgi:pimeloyl-ACP methyl ester carboxylesterase
VTDEVPHLVLPDGLPFPAERWSVRGADRHDGVPVDLAVATIGQATDPAVVLAHGVGSSARYVAAACAAPLVAAGYRLVTYDARGHGASTPCGEVADHDAVVAAVAGDLAAVGGVSLGAHAAVRSRAAGARRVLCLPAWTGRAIPGEGPHAAVAAEVREVGVGRVIDRLRADTVMPVWLRDTLVTDYRRHDPASLTAALLALDGGDAPTDHDLGVLPPRTAVVAWPDDPGHPLEVAQHWSDVVGGRLTTLALTDLDDRLTRFGDAVVTALR